MLQTGALPVEFVTARADRRLGDARQGLAAAGGEGRHRRPARRRALPAVFYRFLGLVAVIGLGIYAAFLYAAILLFNVTLTLPGFAGLILTIGVAADANIVIFERIKEESRAGQIRARGDRRRATRRASTRSSTRTSSRRSLRSCCSRVATAGVKGFALMLLIGTAISMLTAVAATRAMLGLLAGFRWFDNPRFMGAPGQQSRSGCRSTSSAGATSGSRSRARSSLDLRRRARRQGPQPRHRLQGRHAGHVHDAAAGRRSTTSATQAATIGQGNAVIQGRGKASGGDSYTQFQIRTESLTPAEQTQLTHDLAAARSTRRAFGVKNVSASFGRQIARAAILAIIVSLLLIVALHHVPLPAGSSPCR